MPSQLQICSRLYALDNGYRLPPNNVIYDNNTGAPAVGFDGDLTWCPGWARYDATTTNIEKGLLYPYNRAAGIYHCPGDHSSVETSGGRQLGLLRKRSYSLSAAINGQPTNPDFVTWPPNFQKETSERFWELIGETNTIIHHPPQERRRLGELLVR